VTGLITMMSVNDTLMSVSDALMSVSDTLMSMFLCCLDV